MAEAWWELSCATGDHDARVLLYRLGPEKFLDRVLLAWSRAPEGVADEHWRALATLAARWRAPGFPVKAADFLARGVAKGPALGAALRAAEEAWIAEGFPIDSDALERILTATAR